MLHYNKCVQVVKAPGNLVISAYVACPDITLTVTPDLKLPGSGRLLWVDLSGGRKRLGGSALAHAYSQVQYFLPSQIANGTPETALSTIEWSSPYVVVFTATYSACILTNLSITLLDSRFCVYVPCLLTLLGELGNSDPEVL